MNLVAPCKDCGTTDPTLHYVSGRMERCYDCQRYENLRKKTTGGGVAFTRQEFVDWVRADPARRICTYCGIDSRGLYALDILNPRNRRRFESIGLDRRDNQAPYVFENLVPCCAICNAIKSSVFTYDEMKELGLVVERLLRNRSQE